jgi:hypothetical protein
MSKNQHLSPSPSSLLGFEIEIPKMSGFLCLGFSQFSGFLYSGLVRSKKVRKGKGKVRGAICFTVNPQILQGSQGQGLLWDKSSYFS